MKSQLWRVTNILPSPLTTQSGCRRQSNCLGLKAKSLKNGMTFYWTKPDLLARSRARTNKQTMLVLFLSKIYIFLDSWIKTRIWKWILVVQCNRQQRKLKVESKLNVETFLMFFFNLLYKFKAFFFIQIIILKDILDKILSKAQSI